MIAPTKGATHTIFVLRFSAVSLCTFPRLDTLTLLAMSCSKTENAILAVDTNDNILLGNPSGAVVSTNKGK